MLMPLTHRRAVYEELFRSGVMVCEKNCVHKLKGHAYVTLTKAAPAAAGDAAAGAAPVAAAPGDVPRALPTGGASVAANRMGAKTPYIPNLHVIKLMRSLKSRGLVKEQFAWHHYYWWLTNEGIEFLRAELHLPAEIVPATLKRAQRAPDMPGAPGGFGERGRYGDREGGYRSRDRGDAEGGYRRAGAGPASDASKMADVGPGAQGQPSFRGGYGRGRGFGGDRGGPGGAPGGPGGAPSGPGSWRQ